MSPSQTPDIFSESSKPANCFFIYTKTRFFNSIKRFLLLNTLKKQEQNFDQPGKSIGAGKFEEGMEVLKESDSTSQDDWMVLQKSVKGLHFGSWEEKGLAAREIKRLAKEDLKRRKSMAQLGVIQPLVDMVESDVVERQRLAVQALIELANGSFT